MAEIKVLSRAVADKIAAGEVVERPSAVVKELVENSIDAGADRICVEIKNGGIKYISIEDNGKGIPADELEFAFLRHATSKLRDIEDLFEISTMGFRGEALASICAVAEVTVVSRTKDSATGCHMTVKHGVPSEKSEIACNFGTSMTVENIFANVPARMKFLKKDSTEGSYITDVVGRIALANPGIAFRYIADGKEVFSTSGDGKLKNVILNIYGIDHAKALFEVDYTEHGIRVHGAVGKAELARGNRTRQTLMVNGRYIKNHVVAKVVEEAFRNVLMTGKFPFFVLNIDLSPQLVDVNVHPAKTEIKFANEKEVYNIVHLAVKNAIYNRSNAAEPKTVKEETKNPLDAMLDKALSKEASFPGKGSSAEVKAPAEKPDSRIIRDFMERTVPKRDEDIAAEYMFREPTPFVGAGAAQQENLPDNKTAGGFKFNINSKQTVPIEAEAELDAKADTKPCEVPKPEPSVAAESKELTADFVEASALTEPECIPSKVVGQVFDTYVVVQKGSEMFLIDQHAAHERMRFEMLKADYVQKKTAGQILLAPIVVDVEPLELQAVKDNRAVLEDMGFEMEEFGRNSVIIRETPLIGDEDEIKSLAEEVISVLTDNRRVGLLSFEERILDTISCKYAIKANKSLSLPEMEGLVRDVEELEGKGICTCPHGRPIKISFTKREIEKMFKRIV